MMNIETDHYRIQSEPTGGYTVTNLKTNETKHVTNAQHSSYYAAITVNQFNIAMQTLMTERPFAR